MKKIWEDIGVFLVFFYDGYDAVWVPGVMGVVLFVGVGDDFFAALWCAGLFEGHFFGLFCVHNKD